MHARCQKVEWERSNISSCEQHDGGELIASASCLSEPAICFNLSIPIPLRKARAGEDARGGGWIQGFKLWTYCLLFVVFAPFYDDYGGATVDDDDPSFLGTEFTPQVVQYRRNVRQRI